MIELEDQISGAFAGEEEGYWEGEEPAVVPELLRVSLSPVSVSVVELEEEVEKHRRVLVHEDRGVPLSLILVIAGSLFFHGMILGGFLMALYYHRGHISDGMGMASSDSDAGGSGAGYMVMGYGAKGEAVLAGKIPDVVLPSLTLQKPPIAPILPPVLPPKAILLPSKNPEVTKVAAVDPGAIGIPVAPDPLGTIKLPAVAGRDFSREQTAVVSPPDAVAMVSPPSAPVEILPKVEHAPSAGGKTGAEARSPLGGDGMGGDENDEPVIDITKPGKGGEGFGSGGGQGNGLDRGESAADGPVQPTNLFTPTLEPFERPTANAVVEVQMLANGRVGGVKLVQSCGLPSVDEALVRFEKEQQRFRPARRAGVAVDSVWTYELDFFESGGKKKGK